MLRAEYFAYNCNTDRTSKDKEQTAFGLTIAQCILRLSDSDQHPAEKNLNRAR